MRRRDFIQNLIITALAVSALFLFSRTQFFQLGTAAGGGYLRRITAPVGSSPSDTALSDSLSAPVRTAVTGAYGRYADIAMTTGDEGFIPVKTLLREVLGSARNRTGSSQAAFLDALDKASVYCDFLSPLPASYLAELMGIRADSALSVRALTAAEEAGQVVLFLWDGGGNYYRCDTAAQVSALTEVQDHFELGVSSFAFEEAGGSRLAPLSLFPDPLPELPQLTAAETSIPAETLLAALSFNPHTNSRYQDAGGAEVIVEGDRVIRIAASGAFSYTSGGEAALTVSAAGDIPTVPEAVVGVQSLLDSLLPEGEARLYLLSFRQEGGEAVLTFGYHLEGVPIRFADTAAAAEVTLSGRAVSSLTMRPRQYTSGGSASLLPLRQAEAIAERTAGAELSVGYADTGTYPLSAVWLAD